MAIDTISPNVPGLDDSQAFKEARLPGNLQSGTAYTAELADIGRAVRFLGASAAVLTIPKNADCPFPYGTILTVARDGTGAVSIAAASGVTINRPASAAATIGAQYSLVNLRKTGTDTWSMFGGLSAA